jgi:hypothetical protein
MEEKEERCWPCERCTYSNEPSSTTCSACDFPRPNSRHHTSSTLDKHIIDLTEKDDDNEEKDGVNLPSLPSPSPSPLPWKPVYHFQSPQLREVSPHIDQSDHLSLSDIIAEGVEAVVLMNYVVEVPFLVEECPAICNSEVSVLLLHGSKGISLHTHIYIIIAALALPLEAKIWLYCILCAIVNEYNSTQEILKPSTKRVEI